MLKMLKMLKLQGTFWAPHPKKEKTSTSLTFPLFQAHFNPKMLKTGEMLKMLKFEKPKL